MKTHRPGRVSAFSARAPSTISRELDEAAVAGFAGRMVDIMNDVVTRDVSSIVVMVVGALNSNDGVDFPVVTVVRVAAGR